MYGELNEDKQVTEDKYRLYQETSNLCRLTRLDLSECASGDIFPLS